MELVLRFASHEDVNELRSLAEEAFRQAYAWYNTPEDMDNYVRAHFTPEKLSAEMNVPSLRYLLACEGNRIAGYVKLDLQPQELGHCSARPLEIARLYTRVDLIGRGVGKRLVEETVRYAKENGFDSVCLSAWQKNPKAVAFYRREGFTIAGTTTFTLGSDVQDDFIMTRMVE